MTITLLLNLLHVGSMIGIFLVTTYVVRKVLVPDITKTDTRTILQIILAPLFNNVFIKGWSLKTLPIKVMQLVFWMCFIIYYLALYTTIGYMIVYANGWFLLYSVNASQYATLTIIAAYVYMLPVMSGIILSISAKMPAARVYLIEVIGETSYKVYIGANPGSWVDKYGAGTYVLTTAAIVAAGGVTTLYDTMGYKDKMKTHVEAQGQILDQMRKREEEAFQRRKSAADYIYNRRRDHTEQFEKMDNIIKQWHQSEMQKIQESTLKNQAKIKAQTELDDILQKRRNIMLDMYKHEQQDFDLLNEEFAKIVYQAPSPNLNAPNPAGLSQTLNTIFSKAEALAKNLNTMFKK